jgi:hypothetical protein
MGRTEAIDDSGQLASRLLGASYAMQSATSLPEQRALLILQ